MVFAAPAASLSAPDVTRVVELAEAARTPGVQVEAGGPAVENASRGATSATPTGDLS